MGELYSDDNERKFLLIISLVFILLTAYLISNIFVLIIYSMILSYFLFPLHKFYMEKIGNRNLSSLLTLVTATLLLFLPIALLSYFFILNLGLLIQKYRIYIENPEVLNGLIADFIQQISNSDVFSGFDFSSLLNFVVIFISDIFKNFFSSIPRTLLNFFIVLFITYYILIYYKELLKTINEYIPLSLKKQDIILTNLRRSLRVLFRGYFLTALIQTLVALIGYIIFGVPNIVIITLITLFVSLFPYLGTPLVWVPVAFYLVITGNVFSGVMLLLYGIFVISLVDNFVRPMLMSDKNTISPPVVFVGLIGGLLIFGISGIILGPIILSITAILMRFLKENYQLAR